MTGVLADELGLRVKREQVELPPAIGEEVDRVSQPHRLGVVATSFRLWNLLHRMIAGGVDRDAGNRSAPIAFPLLISRRQRIVGDPLAVVRVSSSIGVGNLQQFLHSAARGHLEQLRVSVVVGDAIRGEENRRSVGRESLHQIRPGMPRQSLGNAALHRHHVDVRIALVLGAECEQASIRGEGGMRFQADVAGQTSDAGAVQVGNPEISGIDKGDVSLADRRVVEEPGVADVDPGAAGSGGEDGGRMKEGKARKSNTGTHTSSDRTARKGGRVYTTAIPATPAPTTSQSKPHYNAEPLCSKSLACLSFQSSHCS